MSPDFHMPSSLWRQWLKNSMFFFNFGKCATVAHTFPTQRRTRFVSCSPFVSNFPSQKKSASSSLPSPYSFKISKNSGARGLGLPSSAFFSPHFSFWKAAA